MSVIDCIDIYGIQNGIIRKNVIGEVNDLKWDIKMLFKSFFFEKKKRIELGVKRNILDLVVLKYIGIRMFNPEPL